MKFNALVLAAGRGSRMGSATAKQPKCLTKVKGQSLLSYQLSALRQSGCDTIGLVSGYRREQLIEYFDIEFHNPNWASTNMVASLLCAEPLLSSGPCIVSYSDLFYFSDAVDILAGQQGDICVLYDQNWHDLWSARFDDPLDDAESFIIDTQGHLREIGQKTSELKNVQGQYMGLFKLTPQGWEIFNTHAGKLFQSKGQNIYITDVLNSIAQSQDCPIEAIPFSGQWGEVDSESDQNYYNDL